MKKLTFAAALTALALSTGIAQAQTAWNIGYGARNTGGTVLTDENGRTLYVFDNDRALTSNCAGPCAVNWPPARAGLNSAPGGDWTILERPDGTRQWMHRGRPLYRWINDGQAGQMNGRGFGGVWHVATLQGRLADAAPAAARRPPVARPAARPPAARPATAPAARPAAAPAARPATQARPAPTPTNPRPATRS